MELRGAADVLLRSHSPWSSHLIPSMARVQSSAKSNIHLDHRRCLQRSFVTSTVCRAPLPSQTTTTAPPSTTITGTANKTPDKTARSMGWLKGGIGGNRIGSGGANAERNQNRVGLGSSFGKLSSKPSQEGNSAIDILSALNISSMQSSKFDINQMQDPFPSSGNGFDLMSSMESQVAPPVMPKIPLRLTPETGRTVSIGSNIDVGRGFTLLEQSCGRNKVRSDFNRQRFHERPGLKRKRLKSDRWRKRFRLAFSATVNRVKELKRQGW